MDISPPYTGKLRRVACEYNSMHLLTTLEWLETAYLNNVTTDTWIPLYDGISEALHESY